MQQRPAPRLSPAPPPLPFDPRYRWLVPKGCGRRGSHCPAEKPAVVEEGPDLVDRAVATLHLESVGRRFDPPPGIPAELPRRHLADLRLLEEACNRCPAVFQKPAAAPGRRYWALDASSQRSRAPPHVVK
eukprot:TRINITY_DN17156_c0_g1_i1.p3 TRINITY_DN17156_c0_g1~~TRINITY_DN17156_c0_g1_i1.p3  ORF type:complete len:130 (+),score=5.68 TRINITY_DN17156_c0_g1_i1:55-444(+)